MNGVPGSLALLGEPPTPSPALLGESATPSPVLVGEPPTVRRVSAALSLLGEFTTARWGLRF